MKKGPWSPDEDAKLKEYIDKYGTHGNWIALPHKAGKLSYTPVIFFEPTNEDVFATLWLDFPFFFLDK